MLERKPPGPRDARGVIADRILTAARSLFASAGYASTSLRTVAEAAGVDVALVSYYFKNKAGLRAAVQTLPPGYVAKLQDTLATPPLEDRAGAVMTFHLAAWENS